MGMVREGTRDIWEEEQWRWGFQERAEGVDQPEDGQRQKGYERHGIGGRGVQEADGNGDR